MRCAIGFCFITGCNHDHAAAILYSLPSMSAKLAIVRALALTMPEHEHKTELLCILAAIQKRSRVRNKIVHGNYVGSGDRFGYQVVLITPAVRTGMINRQFQAFWNRISKILSS